MLSYFLSLSLLSWQIVLFLISICAFFAVGCAIWEGLIGQHFQLYLPWEHIIPQDYIASGATVIGLLVFFSYAIVLNTVVPISLYVSVEVSPPPSHAFSSSFYLL